jgi:hypothetical protein
MRFSHSRDQKSEVRCQRLFRRARLGVGFDFVPLFVHYAAQLALHGFECVVDHFVDRFVRAVVHLFLVGDEFVSRRDRHVNATTVRISFVMGVVRLLDRHVAAIDVVAKFLQPRRVVQNEIVDLV